MSLESMLEEFKDVVELQTFARSQYKTIIEQSKEIQKLKEEIKNLRELAAHANPLEIGNKKEDEAAQSFGSSDPEIIARTQLALLKKTSMSGLELTLEESKKVQIYTDVLLKVTGNKQPEEQVRIDAIDPKLLIEAIKSDE